MELSGQRREYIGYFPQWAIYDQQFRISDLDRNGTASKLTILNYAFANISSDTKLHPGYRCFAANADGADAGDAGADWLWPFAAEESVDAVADQGWGANALQGNFNQLRKLKAKYPHLKVLISIGGWTNSRNFSEAVRTPARRKDFVKSFIDFYIRGNLPTKIWDGTEKAWSEVYGGTGVAAGIFDGFDIDWEWPASDAGLEGNRHRPQDKQELPLLLKEFREQLDDLPHQSRGGRYLLTAFLPAESALLQVGWDVPEIMKYLDYGNLQGYDLRGPFDSDGYVTNHQSALHPIADDPHPTTLSVQTTIDAWIKAGARPEKLVLGVPFYGRGWQGVRSDARNGLFQQATGPVPIAPDGAKSETGMNDYRALAPLTKQGYAVHRDDANGVAWLYHPQRRVFWTYDDPTAVSQKVRYAMERGLAGAMAFSLDGDDRTTGVLSQHIRAALDGQQQPPGRADACTAPEWRREYTYWGGSKVTHDGRMWEALYWTRGTEPGSRDNENEYPWRELSSCTMPIRLSADGVNPWTPGVDHQAGALVTHQGELYSAAYSIPASQHQVPGTNPEAWQPHGTY